MCVCVSRLANSCLSIEVNDDFGGHNDCMVATAKNIKWKWLSLQYELWKIELKKKKSTVRNLKHHIHSVSFRRWTWKPKNKNLCVFASICKLQNTNSRMSFFLLMIKSPLVSFWCAHRCSRSLSLFKTAFVEKNFPYIWPYCKRTSLKNPNDELEFSFKHEQSFQRYKSTQLNHFWTEIDLLKGKCDELLMRSFLCIRNSFWNFMKDSIHFKASNELKSFSFLNGIWFTFWE